MLRALSIIAIVTCLLPFASAARAEIELPPLNTSDAIVASADWARHWREGAYDVWLLEGNCQLKQGNCTVQSKHAMLWIERGPSVAEASNKVIAYFEDDVTLDTPLMDVPGVAGNANAKLARMTDKKWLNRFYSNLSADVHAAHVENQPGVQSKIYQHAMAIRKQQSGEVQRTQFQESPGETPSTVVPTPGTRTFQFFGQSNGSTLVSSTQTADKRWMTVISGGFTVRVQGINYRNNRFGTVDTIDVTADRAIVWSSSQISFSGPASEREDEQMELYLEGNVQFRQGDSVFNAQSMYYDVLHFIGTILNAELLTPVPQYDGAVVTLRAAVIEQLNQGHYIAQQASVTTSRLAVPSYEFRSRVLDFVDNGQPVIDPVSGQPAIDPNTLQQHIDHDYYVTGTGNTVLVEDTPIFYWPTIATDLQQPSYYINRAEVRSDNVFGNQFVLGFDMYQLLGWTQKPKGTDWDLNLDYYTERGFGGGTRFKYDRTGMFDMPGHYYGFIDAWFINDHGLDNLGLDRRAIDAEPPRDPRGRAVGRHRQFLPDDWILTGEVGFISDRNFLEEYFEREWDNQIDQLTRLQVTKAWDNSSIALEASVRINNFFIETQWLPRLDHFWLGQPLLNDSITWYEHSSLTYATQGYVPPPTDPQDLMFYTPLAYQISTRGERLATRQELDLPFEAGPVKIVPYALGELARWGQDLNLEDLNRAYGQVGVRASMPMWAADPTIESWLWNVHGVAHKVTFLAEGSIAQSTQNLDQLPIYDEIDDNNIQAFRQHFPFEIFNGSPIPAQFDERFYAVRRGLASDVTGPTEIADDLTAIRLGIDQRWQTKRGPPEQRHIIDWIVLDLNMELFPKDSQNFGEAVGLTDYNFRWHVGDRVTLVSSGAVDWFAQGQKAFNVGGFLTRPPRGSLYMGFYSLEGPISANVLNGSYSYRLSPKWASTFGSSYDFSNTNIGQSFTMTRIGESFLITAGVNVDTSRGSVGGIFLIEPRFLSRTRFSRTSQLALPPSGAFQLE